MKKIAHFYLTWVVCFALVPGYSSAKAIDLRNATEASGEYEISFCARPSPDTVKRLPGHAFVAFSFKPREGGRTFLAIGHTVQAGVSPVDAAWSYFGGAVPGYLAEEKYSAAMTTCLVTKVMKADYEKAISSTKDPLASMGIGDIAAPVLQAYKLGLDDCMGFMTSVADVLAARGLKVPKRGATELPMQYIQRFIAAN